MCMLVGKISGIEIKNSWVLHKCILFGFLNSNPEEKENIYIQRLFQNNSLDVCPCQMQIKTALVI